MSIQYICPLTGPINPHDVSDNFPKAFVMHSCILQWLDFHAHLVYENHIASIPVVVDDDEPRETSWFNIIESSRKARFYPALSVTLSTERLVDTLKDRGYRVHLVK